MAVSHRGAVLLVAMLAAIGRPAFAQVDFSGEWRSVTHETGHDWIGDFTGVPISAAGRLRAETWDAAEFTLPELQCRPHPAAHALRPPNAALAQFRWWKTINPVTQASIAYQVRGAWMEPERTIWMDGRAHPSEYAPHTWLGFSTGRWEGNALKVTTTHLKEGFVYPNGIAVTDKTTLTEVFTRHGNYLTSALFVEDPVYLTQPFLRTSTWVLDSGLVNLQQRYPCGLNEVVIEVLRPKGQVPHHLPGRNPALREFAAAYGLPYEATRGGADTLYPEYMQKLKEMKPERQPASNPTPTTRPDR